MTSSKIELDKDAYLALSNGNYASLEDASAEYISVLAEDEGDDVDVEALKGVLIATMNYLRTQRKLDAWLQKNVPAPSRDVIDYSLEVADTIGLTDNVSVSLNVDFDESVMYKELLAIIYPQK